MKFSIILSMILVIFLASTVNSLPTKQPTVDKIDVSNDSEDVPDAKNVEAVNSYLLQSMRKLLTRETVRKNNSKQPTLLPVASARTPEQLKELNRRLPIDWLDTRLGAIEVAVRKLKIKVEKIEEKTTPTEYVTSGDQSGGQTNSPLIIEILGLSNENTEEAYPVSPVQPSTSNSGVGVPISSHIGYYIKRH